MIISLDISCEQRMLDVNHLEVNRGVKNNIYVGLTHVYVWFLQDSCESFYKDIYNIEINYIQIMNMTINLPITPGTPTSHTYQPHQPATPTSHTNQPHLPATSTSHTY